MPLHYLDAEAIVAQAAREDDLQRYVSDDLVERFKAFIMPFNELGAITDSAISGANEQLTNLVRNRLKLERDWQQHPEILEEQIEAPFFVIGNARSGTTVAQCLLAEDNGHRTPRYWESRYPSPPPGISLERDAMAIAAETLRVEEINRAAPRLLKIHPFLEQGGLAEAECEDLYTNDFHIPHVMHFNQVPNVPQAIPPSDAVSAFSFHKKLLQQFQWQMPTTRWVCKGPAHHYNLPALLEVYPDAQCFWMHRRPDEYLISMLEMLEIVYQPINGSLYNVDPKQIIADLRNGFDYILNSPCIDDSRIHHINFHQFIKDPVASLAPCYEKAGVDFTQDFARKINQWLDNPANRSDRYGKLTYDENKYGVSKQDIRELFADYYQRFGLND